MNNLEKLIEAAKLDVNSLHNRLKPDGLVVEYRHFRYQHYEDKFAKFVNTPRGGFTLAYIIDEDKVYIGIANCSWNDNFNKAVGRVVASSKAIYTPVEIDQCRLDYLLSALDAWDFADNSDDPDVFEAIYGKDRYKNK